MSVQKHYPVLDIHLIINKFTINCISYYHIMAKQLWCNAHRVAAVSSAVDGRHTHYLTAAVRAADGRRTVTLKPQLKMPRIVTIQDIRCTGITIVTLPQHRERNMVSYGQKPNDNYKQETRNYRDGNIYMQHK